MLARDLAEHYPSVTTDDDAVQALHLLAEHGLPALLVVDPDGLPWAVVPGSQLVRQLVPDYVQEDPLIAAVVTDRNVGEMKEELAGRSAAEWLPRRRCTPPFVGPDASATTVAALMARTHTPLVAVIERDGDRVHLVGAVTAARLLGQLIG
ncbi:CBS domain-containing protein [Streptomyces indicus]|uniref:CBS domain-containing protein n=1 Tax=Streptomyces indicus TaxID=417292 RepID=A0A1G9GPL3_9ACTN|nr:CBS domain-containing protein [Streptomyces indicus]SDL02597.1 hypothetical protein SAMN05421806_116130 [Streptomyces indicus]